MKKLFALLLALCLCFSAVAGFAADINWADVEETAVGLAGEGQFYALNAFPLMYWVPNTMTYAEPDDSMLEIGILAYYQTEDEAKWICVQYVDAEGVATIDMLNTVLADAGYGDIETATVNGLTAVTGSNETDGLVAAAFLTDDGNVLVFSFGYDTADETSAQVAALICASIQAVQQ